MKKVTVLLMSLLLVVSFTACGSRDGGETASDTEPAEEVLSETSGTEEENGEETEIQQPEETEGQEEPVAEPETEEPAAETEAGGKVLVVYYSATGNTESVANYIAEATGADMLKLEPVEPYSGGDLDWTDQNSRVVYEHDNPEARKMELVAATVDDWDSYDTVFIGYPIWWGIAAWPVDSFIEANDFSGKTVVPFCTSSSSELGESGKLLEEAAGTGNWLEGERFRSRASEEDVKKWVEGLEL